MDQTKYTITELPKWRKEAHLVKTTSDLLKEIAEYRKLYSKLSKEATQFCEQHFARAMVIDYIHNLNIGELVGTQTKEETRELLEKLLQSKQDPTRSPEKVARAQLETINTYGAMTEFRNLRSEMEKTGLLTVQEICRIHAILMKDLHREAGNMRNVPVLTYHSNTVHFYPEHELVEALFFALVDRYNIHVHGSPHDKDSVEYVSHVFKTAALLMFEFVDTHPFNDGNGRMCRLLANYAISHITPFPVGLYHSTNPARSARSDYVDALVKCSDKPQEGPGDIAAMLVDGAYWGWKSLFNNLERRNQLEPGVVVVLPLVVQKSQPSDIKERVKRVVSSYSKTRTQAFSVDHIVELVVGETQKANVCKSNPCEGVTSKVELAEGVSLDLQIYP